MKVLLSIILLSLLQQALNKEILPLGASSFCTSTAYNLLSNCNLTCTVCGSQRDICQKCEDSLVLSGTNCVSGPNITTIFSQFFMGDRPSNDSFAYTKITTQEGTIQTTKKVQICIASIYRFEIIGLFNSQDFVTYTHQYVFAVSTISLSFRFYSSETLSTIFVVVNNKKQYELSINSGVQTPLNLTNDNELLFENDVSQTRDNFLVPIRTGNMNAQDTRQIIVQFYVYSEFSSNESLTQYWGFSQVTFVATQCNVCVSDQIKLLAETIGLAIGISAGVLVFLVIILCVCVKWRESAQKRKRKDKFQKLKKSENEKKNA